MFFCCSSVRCFAETEPTSKCQPEALGLLYQMEPPEFTGIYFNDMIICTEKKEKSMEGGVVFQDPREGRSSSRAGAPES